MKGRGRENNQAQTGAQAEEQNGVCVKEEKSMRAHE